MAIRLTMAAMIAVGALLAPETAAAQVRGGERGTPWLPQDIRPMGFQQGRYKSGFEYTAHFEVDQCKQLGCLVVINKSQTFEITQLYINDGKIDSRGLPDWGANQFHGFSLEPSHALWTVKPRKMKCEMVVRVIMRNPANNEEVEGVQSLNMCNMPKGGFAVMGFQADGPRVILESGN